MVDTHTQLRGNRTTGSSIISTVTRELVAFVSFFGLSSLCVNDWQLDRNVIFTLLPCACTCLEFLCDLDHHHHPLPTISKYHSSCIMDVGYLDHHHHHPLPTIITLQGEYSLCPSIDYVRVALSMLFNWHPGLLLRSVPLLSLLVSLPSTFSLSLSLTPSHSNRHHHHRNHLIGAYTRNVSITTELCVWTFLKREKMEDVYSLCRWYWSDSKTSQGLVIDMSTKYIREHIPPDHTTTTTTVIVRWLALRWW